MRFSLLAIFYSQVKKTAFLFCSSRRACAASSYVLVAELEFVASELADEENRT